MAIPQGFKNISTKDYVLKLNKNLCGLKQAALKWFQTLKTSLI